MCVRLPQCTTTPEFCLFAYAQAAKEGCLNIVRQAEKAGIKQIVVISSVAALLVLAAGVTIKAPITSNGMSVPRLQPIGPPVFLFRLFDGPITVCRLV